MFDRNADAALFAAYWIGRRVRRQGSPMDERDWDGTVVRIGQSGFGAGLMLIVDWDNSSGNSILYSVTSIKEI